MIRGVRVPPVVRIPMRKRRGVHVAATGRVQPVATTCASMSHETSILLWDFRFPEPQSAKPTVRSRPLTWCERQLGMRGRAASVGQIRVHHLPVAGVEQSLERVQHPAPDPVSVGLDRRLALTLSPSLRLDPASTACIAVGTAPPTSRESALAAQLTADTRRTTLPAPVSVITSPFVRPS